MTIPKVRTSMGLFVLIALASVGILVPVTACRRAGSDQESPASAAPDGDAQSPPKPVADFVIPKRVNIAVPAEAPDRWLTVEAIRGDAPGAWADGTYDAKSNKVIIDTHDVARFALDVGRIPIRWEKLVIIRIDGRNSEFVRRDQTIYRFALDNHGQWAVLDP